MEQPAEIHDDDYHSYVFTSDGTPVARFEVNNVYNDKAGVWGEVSVMYLFDGQDQWVTKHKRANLLQDKRPGIDDLTEKAPQWEWDAWYEYVTSGTVDASRMPPKVSPLVPTPDDGILAPFLIEPFILTRGVSLIFGPGGTGKSMVALAMAVCVASGRTVFGHRPTATGPVLYFDYEDDMRTHEQRLAAVLEGLNMKPEQLKHPILYLKPRQPVSKMRRELLGLVREHDPVLTIVDSIGLARGGDAMSGDETIRLFSTLHSLDTAVLGLDHMTKDDVRGGKQVTPYGSIYTVNSVRLAWSVRAVDASNDTNTYLNFVQTKRNNVASHKPVGAHIKFFNELLPFGPDGEVTQPVLRKVTFDMTDIWWDSDEHSTIAKVVEYMEEFGNVTASILSTAIGVKLNTLVQTLKRHEGKELRKISASKPVVWGLK